MADLPDNPTSGIPPPIHLPPLPALTTLAIDVDPFDPSPHLKNILCPIHSAPALSSIAIEHPNWKYIERSYLWAPWVDIDKWLSRIAKQNDGQKASQSGKDSYLSSGSLEEKSRWTIVCGDADDRELGKPPPPTSRLQHIHVQVGLRLDRTPKWPRCWR